MAQGACRASDINPESITSTYLAVAAVDKRYMWGRAPIKRAIGSTLHHHRVQQVGEKLLEFHTTCCKPGIPIPRAYSLRVPAYAVERFTPGFRELARHGSNGAGEPTRKLKS